MSVEYKALEKFTDYLFGSDGTIISIKFNKWKILKQVRRKKDRLAVRLCFFDGKNQIKMYDVAPLICEAFYGPKPQNMECSHLDGNSLNNQKSNLKWETRTENNRRKVLHGTSLSERSPNAKVNKEIVLKIKKLLQNGLSTIEIAKIFNISRYLVYRIKIGANWKTVKLEN